MNSHAPDPLEELLRARLRIPVGSNFKLKALRSFMGTIDGISRATTGQPFFALRETRQMLVALDGRTGDALVETLLTMNGGTTITPIGLENVPPQGPVVIGATHPIGTFDFIAHAGALRAHRSDLKVVAGREAERFLGKDRIIAVDLDRKDQVITARQTLNGMRAHLNEGGALLVFGSGRVPRMENGLLIERPWRNGITRISDECAAPIVPASTDMRNSSHYYRTRRLAAVLSGGNDELGRRVASLRYASEIFAKLGGSYDVHYGPVQPHGTAPEILQDLAETLVPGLYRS
ncbi:1-acyl-sn-glycerol-3-phosphate acyltransferase [Amylibacter sp. IMCC11727]|uniref:1-acyl-sn-glycerol-3-phosphate acyltransferase n=1 Tax=Amylibacter sp. IMCC11727 TaxID=3039851 RepID=UPI00244DE0CD|nr:1-acyl-sn-glycerol-3-phosphate acyltransferase [Amylibacter sp. IMCC11727]WGI22416.1 1-acyl-sn-glycerol-3-phosphate acyltransferase [Amylibacter sp. IMCC11727]